MAVESWNSRSTQSKSWKISVESWNVCRLGRLFSYWLISAKKPLEKLVQLLSLATPRVCTKINEDAQRDLSCVRVCLILFVCCFGAVSVLLRCFFFMFCRKLVLRIHAVLFSVFVVSFLRVLEWMLDFLPQCVWWGVSAVLVLRF